MNVKLAAVAPEDVAPVELPLVRKGARSAGEEGSEQVRLPAARAAVERVPQVRAPGDFRDLRTCLRSAEQRGKSGRLSPRKSVSAPEPSRLPRRISPAEKVPQ